MINFSDLKIGDYVMAEFDGKMQEGVVRRLNHDEKQVCVENEVQEFWYDVNHIFPIPLSDDLLLRMNFVREQNDDGSVKYKKGSFRIWIPSKDDFNQIQIWYREDQRPFNHPLMLHELQNHYLEMTKIHLTKDVMV